MPKPYKTKAKMMLKQKFYNITTWIRHKIFRYPIYMSAHYDNKRKNPELTVIFLHGISADSETWRATYNQFQKEPDLKSVRLVMLDLLGFGKSLRSDWLNYAYEDYNRALDNTLRHLHIKTPIVLVGHSMGGLIAANYATQHTSTPELTRLILVSPPVLMAAELARLPDKAYTKTYGNLHKIAKEVPAAEVVARIIQKFSSFRNYLKTTAFAKSMENIILCRKNYQTFTSLRIPTLLIHGYLDPLVMGSNLRRVAKQTPKYVRYQSAIGHHDISVGKRAKILLEIKRAIKDVKQTQTQTL